MTRRITSLILAVFLLLPAALGISARADERAPVVLVMPGAVGEAALPGDLDVVYAVSSHLQALGKVEVIGFDPDNPTIARFILEREYGDEYLAKLVDPKVIKEVAALFKPDYILTAHGQVQSDVALVALRLTKTSGKGEWTAAAESRFISADGPIGTSNRVNAVSTAASSAVSQIDIAAFGKVSAKPAPVDDPPANAPPVAPVEEPSSRDLVAEYTGHMNAAERYAQQKDLPNVIYSLRQAVNLEPKTVSVRVKLAEAYSALGMIDEAVDELRRALLFRPDDPTIHKALGEYYVAGGSLKDAAELFREAIKLDAGNVEARISLGNILWNQSKLDEAAAVFEEAAKLDPSNAVPHERLYKLYWARKNFPLAVEHLIASKASTAALDEAARYKLMAGAVHGRLGEIMGKIDENWKDYQIGSLAREDYYRDCSDTADRIGELAAFLSTQTAPGGLKGAHAHGVLSASLMSQSVSSMVSYLETDKQQYSEQAALFREEAQTELDDFGAAIGE